MSSFETRKQIMIQLGFSESKLAILEKYFKSLVAANEELNLFSRQTSLDELLDNHFIDCLLPLSHFPTQIKVVADFGTGGGLPGIIYAIQFPKIKFLLFEKSPKKQDFLRSLTPLVSNIEIFGTIPSKLTNVNLVVARGFKPLDVILELSRDYYQNKGAYFLLKGKKLKIEEEVILARKKFKNFSPNILQLKSPVLDVERNLVQF